MLWIRNCGTSLLVHLLSFPKNLGLNPGISGRKEEILGYVFILKRAHRAETDFTNIEWFPHCILTGATTPPLSEEDPIRARPASTSQPSYSGTKALTHIFFLRKEHYTGDRKNWVKFTYLCCNSERKIPHICRDFILDLFLLFRAKLFTIRFPWYFKFSPTLTHPLAHNRINQDNFFIFGTLYSSS